MNTNEGIAADVKSARGDVAVAGERDGHPSMLPMTDLRAALDVYRRELMRWIDDPGASESSLRLASHLLCDASRERGMLPEQVLIAVHPDGATPPWGAHHSAHQVRRETRYRWAIRLLVRTYFGLEGRQDSSSRFVR